MIRHSLISHFIKYLGVTLVLSLAACVYDPYYSGPPPHAHHPHYNPYYYDYYYYPSAQVYFHYSTGYYFYLSGNQWIRSKALPPKIFLDRRDRTHVWIEGDKPYLKHKEFKQQYKPQPKYGVDPEINRRERQAHKKWVEQHQKKPRNLKKR